MKLLPSKHDARDQHFASHKFFSAPQQFPRSYILPGLEYPDQNRDNRPTACTSYAITQYQRLMKQVQFSHDFQFMESCIAGNTDGANGIDLRTALSVSYKKGFLPLSNEPTLVSTLTQGQVAFAGAWPGFSNLESIASGWKTGGYHPLVPSFGQDYYDAARTILVNKQPVILATQWSNDFENIGRAGKLPTNPQGLYFGHCYLAVGYEVVDGDECLILLTWQGEDYANGGLCYMPRTLVNNLMRTYGALGATLGTLDSTQIDALKAQYVSLLKQLITALQNLLISKGIQPTMTPAERLYQSAKNALGTHRTLNEAVPPELGCAEALSSIIKDAGVQGIPAQGFAGTIAVSAWIKGNPQFEKIDAPEAGAVIISTSEGATHGHCGVIAQYDLQYNKDWGVISNDSSTGTVREQWSYQNWLKYYRTTLGLGVDIYRRVA